MSLTASLRLSINWALTKSLDLSTPRDSGSQLLGPEYADGSGANQADSMWHDERTLAVSANETLDLNAITDALGTAKTISKLKALVIYNVPASEGGQDAAALIVGGADATQVPIFSDPTTDKILVAPGGLFVLTAPLAAGIDISTNKNLKIAHDGAGSSAAKFRIVEVGVD